MVGRKETALSSQHSNGDISPADEDIRNVLLLAYRNVRERPVDTSSSRIDIDGLYVFSIGYKMFTPVFDNGSKGAKTTTVQTLSL